jgi:hypothetical protein
MCTPGWMRRRGKQQRYSEPVSLAEALDRELPDAWPAMIARHAACLAALTTAAARAATADPGGELGTPEIGLPVLMFAGELAAAVQPSPCRDQLPDDLIAAGEHTGVHGCPGGEHVLVRDDGTHRYFTVRECAILQGFRGDKESLAGGPNVSAPEPACGDTRYRAGDRDRP